MPSIDQTGIDGESLAANQTSLNAHPYDALEYATKDFALTKALIAGAEERRLVRYDVFQARAAI